MATRITAIVECQYCESTDTYPAGYSPYCIETQYKCRNCKQDTWHDDRNETE